MNSIQNTLINIRKLFENIKHFSTNRIALASFELQLTPARKREREDEINKTWNEAKKKYTQT